MPAAGSPIYIVFTSCSVLRLALVHVEKTRSSLDACRVSDGDPSGGFYPLPLVT